MLYLGVRIVAHAAVALEVINFVAATARPRPWREIKTPEMVRIFFVTATTEVIYRPGGSAKLSIFRPHKDSSGETMEIMNERSPGQQGRVIMLSGIHGAKNSTQKMDSTTSP